MTIPQDLLLTDVIQNTVPGTLQLLWFVFRLLIKCLKQMFISYRNKAIKKKTTNFTLI